MQGKDYVQYMTLSEWIQWRDNTADQNKYKDVKLYLLKDFDTFFEFISWSFCWDKSPEKHAYWSNIAWRDKPLTK